MERGKAYMGKIHTYAFNTSPINWQMPITNTRYKAVQTLGSSTHAPLQYTT